MTEISYRLMIDGNPADADLVAAIRQIEVEDHSSMAAMLRLRLAIGPVEDGSGWNILDDDPLPRLTKLRLDLKVGTRSEEPLIAADIVETAAHLASEPGRSVLDVVAMDPSVRMSLEEKMRPWPDMSDADVAEAIFQEHSFTPVVESTEPSRAELTHLTTQRGTDIQFLRQLAERNGFECYVEINPTSGDIEGHFHPPHLDERPQGVLSVNMGLATNVNSFRGRFDMLLATSVKVVGLDVEDLSDQPAEIGSADLRPLGGGLPGGGPPRVVLLSQTGLASAGELQTLAQAVANRSGWAITAEGDLSTLTYGGILRAKRPVMVRGAGRLFSGTYYVDRVLHTIAEEGYTQKFALRRNALGLTGGENFREDRGAT